MRVPGSLEVLRDGNFARYFAARTISSLGGSMATVALAFAALDFGGVEDLGIVLLVREVPMVILLLLGGVWADRLSRRLILVASDVLMASAQAATAALLLTGEAQLWNVAALQMVFGVSGAFSRPATTGLVQEIVAPARLQSANALLSVSRSTVWVGGPAVGALIVTAASPGWAIAVDAATFAASAGLVASMRLVPVARTATTSVLADLRAGWGEFRSRPWVVAMVSSFGFFQLTYFPALLVLGPAIADEDLGGAGPWGAILSAGAVGSIVGGLLALRTRFRRPLVGMSVLLFPCSLLLAAIAVPLPVPLIAVAAFFGNACLSLGDPIWFATLQEKIPAHAISRISSFDWLGSVALNPLGYALIGPLAVALGLTTTMLIAAVANAAVVAALLLSRTVWAVEAGPEVPEEAPA